MELWAAARVPITFALLCRVRAVASMRTDG